jgi:hypothetical protein
VVKSGENEMDAPATGSRKDPNQTSLSSRQRLTKRGLTVD